MKRLNRILIILLSSVLILTLIGYIGLVTAWRSYLTEKEMFEIAKEVRAVKPLPDEFLNLYTKLYPYKQAPIIQELFMRVKGGMSGGYAESRKYNSSFDDVFYNTMIEQKIRDKDIEHHILLPAMLGYGLSRYCTSQQCLSYTIRHEYLDMQRAKGGYLFDGKDLDSLTRDEMIDFFVAEKAPSLYSPLRSPEKYAQRKATILAQLND